MPKPSQRFTPQLVTVPHRISDDAGLGLINYGQAVRAMATWSLLADTPAHFKVGAFTFPFSATAVELLRASLDEHNTREPVCVRLLMDGDTEVGCFFISSVEHCECCGTVFVAIIAAPDWLPPSPVTEVACA